MSQPWPLHTILPLPLYCSKARPLAELSRIQGSLDTREAGKLSVAAHPGDVADRFW